MILEIRIMMKSRRHFTHPSKICRENGVVPKGYCRDIYDDFDWVGSATNKKITPYCRKRTSISLSATKDEYIVAEKKAGEYSSSDEEYVEL